MTIIRRSLVGALAAFMAIGPLSTAARPAYDVVQVAPRAQAAKAKVLYSFKNGADGAYPAASLIDVNGVLYGTTQNGGTTTSCTGCGTVFSVDRKTGAEKVVYSFCGQPNCADGAFPTAALIEVQGTLYGTTMEGGTGPAVDCHSLGVDGCGTVFSIDPTTGEEKVLYSFCNQQRSQQYCTDGALPEAAVVYDNGTLYGTTASGGSQGAGEVFALDLSTGTETVAYSFCNLRNCTDGNEPAGLFEMKGVLYGTTIHGGSSENCSGGGCGTVYKLDPQTGQEAVVHSFGGGKDGEHPAGVLSGTERVLYGTTVDGANGGGTVFSVDLASENESVLYAFCRKSQCEDGRSPAAGVIEVSGTLYGTAPLGGSGGCTNGCGTLFSLDPTTRKETVLHSFESKHGDGQNPVAALVKVGGTLYGTTTGGGTSKAGTVFEARP